MTKSNSDRATSYTSATLVECLRDQAAQQPDQQVYTFLADGETEEASLTFAELDRQARAVAAELQRLGMAGERALLLYPPSLAYIIGFFGCLYAGVIAVPAYPPHPARLTRSLPRIAAIVANSHAKVALTTSATFAITASIFEQAPSLAAMHWLATDTIQAGVEQAYTSPVISADTLAFLQYTSGSTGTPKGVMLSHGNLLANITLISQSFELAPGDAYLSWLPPYHDMGLIGGILTPLCNGEHCVLMSPMSFLQRPLRWLQAITRHRSTISGGPNFAYDLCARKITPEQVATLDLSSWSMAFSGAEPVRAETLRRFATTFAPADFRYEAFYPCYGLAEATLFVTGGGRATPAIELTVQAPALERNQIAAATADEHDSTTLVSCGYVRAGQQLMIVDPDSGLRCAEDRVGEIWVTGASIAQGYWDQPDTTTETFQARIDDVDGATFLRTGDLGFVRDDELYVTGRLKDLIILDGRNHYPQDIEATVEQSHPAVRRDGCAAFSVEIGGAERLVVVAEVERSFLSAQRRRTSAAADSATSRSVSASEEVVAAIRRAISEQHELRTHAVVLLKTGHLPKTSSGKIQRHACRTGFLTNTLEVLED